VGGGQRRRRTKQELYVCIYILCCKERMTSERVMRTVQAYEDSLTVQSR
jgi:hypothetical protein